MRHQRCALRPQARRCRALLARMQTEGLSAEASGMADRLTLVRRSAINLVFVRLMAAVIALAALFAALHYWPFGHG